MTPGLATAEIAARFACCTEELDPADQRTQLILFRLLAGGKPVELAKLARAAGLEAPDVAARLESWHGVHTDEAGRIVAFQGLSVVEAPHRMRVDGRTLYAWCAWDTLFLPELIGKPTGVESACPSTGAKVSLRVGPDGPADLSPAEAVMSFVLPGTRFREDTIASFCNFIHYFASPRAAAEWTAERPGTFVISIEQAFEIGRHTNAQQWPEAIGRAGHRERGWMNPRRDATVESLREALRRSDLSLFEGLLADDVRWYGNFPGGACHNREQVLATLHGVMEGGVRPQVEATRSEGDRVLLQLRLEGAMESADPVPRIWLALTVDHVGRITELQDYSTKATAEHDAALRARRPATDDPSPASPVTGLVPFAHVAEVERSVAFFELLGLELRETYEHEGRLVWASMGRARAALMLAESEAPIDAGAQGVLFYLYAENLAGLRDHLVAHGITAGEIVDGSPGPKREMRVTDPDGYCLMVAQIDD